MASVQANPAPGRIACILTFRFGAGECERVAVRVIGFDDDGVPPLNTEEQTKYVEWLEPIWDEMEEIEEKLGGKPEPLDDWEERWERASVAARETKRRMAADIGQGDG